MLTALRLSVLLSGLMAATISVDAMAATPEEIIKQSQQAFYYAGDDAKGTMTMALIDRGGGKRIRVMLMLRRNKADSRDQKYFIYFKEPGDVRRLTFMIWKYPAREDDRWIYVPAVDLIRRIAAEDKFSSFVGSDFSYEDVSGRDVAEDTHTLIREEKLGDRDTFVIQSIPKGAAAFTKKILWIDKQNFLPLKEEYYDAQKELWRIYTADNVENIAVGKGKNRRIYPTVMKRTMKNVKTGHRTEVTVNSVTYNLNLKDKDFSERRMRRPPRAWIR